MLLQIQPVGARSSAFQALGIWHHNVPLKSSHIEEVRESFSSLSFTLKWFFFFAFRSKNLYATPNIWYVFGWTFRSMALFQPPSPRRQVNVSAFSHWVTWRRNRAAGVKLLLRVIIGANHAGLHEAAGDWMWLSRDAWWDRPLTLRLASGSPLVRLRTLGRPVQNATADLNLASSLEFLTVRKKKTLMCWTDQKKNHVFFFFFYRRLILNSLGFS